METGVSRIGRIVSRLCLLFCSWIGLAESGSGSESEGKYNRQEGGERRQRRNLRERSVIMVWGVPLSESCSSHFSDSDSEIRLSLWHASPPSRWNDQGGWALVGHVDASREEKLFCDILYLDVESDS